MAGYAQLNELKARHMRAIEMFCAGQTPTEVAISLDVSAPTISSWLSAPLFAGELARKKGECEKRQALALSRADWDAQRVLDANSKRAAERLVELAEVYDHKVAIQACKEILDRTIEKKSVAGPMLVINAEAMQLVQLIIAESQSILPSKAEAA